MSHDGELVAGRLFHCAKGHNAHANDGTSHLGTFFTAAACSTPRAFQRMNAFAASVAEDDLLAMRTVPGALRSVSGVGPPRRRPQVAHVTSKQTSA